MPLLEIFDIVVNGTVRDFGGRPSVQFSSVLYSFWGMWPYNRLVPQEILDMLLVTQPQRTLSFSE